MGETSTLNELTNQKEVMKESGKENLEADELIFYHSLRPQLDQLQQNPKLQTIHNILDYSRSLR